MSELKPCPFCGGENTAKVMTDYSGSETVCCGRCDCSGPIRDTKPEAKLAWNTRPSAQGGEGGWDGPCNQCGGFGGHEDGCTGHKPAQGGEVEALRAICNALPFNFEHLYIHGGLHNGARSFNFSHDDEVAFNNAIHKCLTALRQSSPWIAVSERPAKVGNSEWGVYQDKWGVYHAFRGEAKDPEAVIWMPLPSPPHPKGVN